MFKFFPNLINKFLTNKKMVEEASEIVVIVDRENNVIGSENRKTMRENILIHRSTYIFIQNSKKQFHVHKSITLLIELIFSKIFKTTKTKKIRFQIHSFVFYFLAFISIEINIINIII